MPISIEQIGRFYESKKPYLPNWAEITIIELAQAVTFLGVRLGNLRNSDFITITTVLLGYSTFVYSHYTWLTRANRHMTESHHDTPNE